MNASQILQFFGISLIPFISAVLLHLFFKLIKKHPTNKPIHQEQENWFIRYFIYPIKYFIYLISATKRGHYWFKQIFSGAVLGSISIAGYFAGVMVNVGNNPLVPFTHKFIVGNSTIPPVIASLIFGWPAGLLSSIIGFSFRITKYGFLQMPTVTAIAFSGIFSGAASHFLFRDKHPRWYLSFLCGVLVETFNMLLIFSFNISHINEAYDLLIRFDVPCIVFAALSTTLTSLAIAIIDREYLFPHKKEINNATTKIQLALFLISAAGLIITGTTIQGVTDAKAYEDFNFLTNESNNDAAIDFNNYLDYVDSNPGAIEGWVTNAMSFVQAVTGHHHTTPKSFVAVVATNDFVRIVNEFCAPGTLDFDLEPGMVVGVTPNGEGVEHNIKEKEDFIEINGTNISEYGYDDKYVVFEPQFININQIDYMVAARVVYTISSIKVPPELGEVVPHFYILTFVPKSEVTTSAGVSFHVVFYMDVIIFILIFLSSIYFINVKIIDRIEAMDNGLEKIMDGDLDYTLQVKGYNEFKNLSNNINLAIGALRNYADEVQHQIDAELKLARDIQLGSVLKAFPSEENYNIYAKMEPAKEVGGDFYDYVKMNNGRVMFVIADVSGKGVPAALFMMRAKTLIKSMASTDLPLADIVSIANNDLCTQNEAGFFVTAWIGILDTKNGELRYVSAGHPNPIVKHNGKFAEFKNKHSPALAVFPDTKYEVEIGYFEPGDEIVLYTDGITEAQNNHLELYGINRLIDAANNAKYFTAKQLLDEITDDVSRFANGEEQFDDITLLIIRYLGDPKNIRPETTITLKTRPNNASIAVNFVESILTKFNLTAAFVAKISIVVDELFANVAFYAYPKDYIGELSIEVDMREDSLYLNFIDSGKPFDPTKPRETNLSSNIDDRERGGLGIYIVKKTMDEIKYEYKDNRNMLRLMKKILPTDKNDDAKN